ncbi:phosphatase PAP2 family protein [Kocuria marina]|uniref:phosphatase PAP2 family protein n=1 Tax=Kocuria marina TaxID=223184 RepID=UPI00272E2F00
MQYALSNGAVVLIIAAVIGWLAVLRRRPLDATGFGITALAGWGAVGLVKVFVERPRPTFLSGEALAPVTGSMSFPSSHTGAVVAIALAMGLVASRRSSRRRIALLGTLAVVIVGAARMYSGAHYPLDILAAVPVAWAGVMAGCALANKVVPALAFGFSWRQAGVSQPAPATMRGAGSTTTTAPAPSYRPARAVPLWTARAARRADRPRGLSVLSITYHRRRRAGPWGPARRSTGRWLVARVVTPRQGRWRVTGNGRRRSLRRRRTPPSHTAQGIRPRAAAAAWWVP